MSMTATPVATATASARARVEHEADPRPSPPGADLSSLVLRSTEHDPQPRWQRGERLHGLFEQRCDELASAGRIDQCAVESDEATLSYDALDRRANQFARYLQGRGIGPGSVVALLFDKTVHAYVSMLAVLKAGAAYVPLDGSFPADRIGFIAGDAQVRLILSTSGYRERLSRIEVPLCCVDEMECELDACADTRLAVSVTGPESVADDALCYVIYTSGSTGRPKGVPIQHSSICNFVRVAAEVYGYQPTDRVYQGLTLAFDFAVEEIWVPWMVGATLLPNQTGASLLGRDLSSFLIDRRVTALCCVPTLLATVDEDVPSLRLLIVSGEACPRHLVDRWHRPDRTMLNAYGPTEITVTATLGTLRPGAPVTIGKPLPTYSIVILAPDETRALPFGETGEIGVAGIGVARGYLNRDEQTRKVFIADFLDIPHNASGRIYRTGDLGRVNERGEVEYLGRLDTQVKIRGYRIELAEVESVALRVPGLAQAVVSTHEATPGAVELVAYYTWTDPEHGPDPQTVAAELRAMLPTYMVPTFYERLQAMPMLASDKADRKALPKPSGLRLVSAGREHVSAEGELELEIAQLLGRTLEIDLVSVEDHFFENLGANSLLMARFNARLRTELGYTGCSIRDIYLHPTVRRLAALLQSAPRHMPGPTQTPTEVEPLPTVSRVQHAICGSVQLVLAFAFLWFNATVVLEGWRWTLAAPDLAAAYGRAVGFSIAAFALAAALPVAVKWLLIGRWTAQDFPVWGLRYLRFWVVKSLVRTNPLVLLAGSPLYTAYLRCLGARVSWSAVVLSPVVPVCTDLVSIGDEAVVTKSVSLNSYHAKAMRIHTGPVHIGHRAYVGEASVLDIHTALGDGSQLGHASSLQRGQRLAANTCHHGSPAVPTATRFAPSHAELGAAPIRVGRRIAYSLGQLAMLFLVVLPLPTAVAYHLLTPHDNGWGLAALLEAPASLGDLPFVVGGAALVFLGSLLFGLAAVIGLPRLLARLIEPGRVYPLYGFHYAVSRAIARLSNSKIYNTMLGDSAFIVHYLRAIGYRFVDGIEQTGSNFGLSQRQDHPLLCNIGRGTMVSDGLSMENLEIASHSFRVLPVSIGAHNFLGNVVSFPAHARTGANCLFATKVAVPIDGVVRENVGLLGSPCFEIPRSTRSDLALAHDKSPEVLRQRMRQKRASNARTIGLYLVSNGWAFVFSALLWHYTYFELDAYGSFFLAAFAAVNAALLMAHYIFVDRLTLGFGRLQAQHCSIYDPYFWRHERMWKLGLSNDQLPLQTLNGTPFKAWAWRLLGVRVGRMLFDDGGSIPEKSLVQIGDHCCLNDRSVLQAHSLEDGVFKSDRIVVEDACTVGVGAYVHYDVVIHTGSQVGTDSFLMKGERTSAHAYWVGNPARNMPTHIPTPRPAGAHA